MKKGINPNRSICSIEAYTKWVQEVIEATYIDGEDGVYFRLCKAAADLTGAKHCIVVLPASSDTLKVVGCCGMPTALLEEFPKKRGVIGDAFISGKVIKVDDVKEYKKDHSYYSYDEHVNSELTVPIIDHVYNTVVALINLESTDPNYFKNYDVDVIYRLGSLALKHRSFLEDKLNSEKYNNFLLDILDNTPDELMIIDSQYRPVYANKVKRSKLRDLDLYLNELGNEPLRKFVFSQLYSSNKQGKTCYAVIEKRDNICPHCVCRDAFAHKSCKQGILYKSLNLPEEMLELSAGPLFSANKKPFCCIETVRYVTKREKVIETSLQLLDVYTEELLFQKIATLMHENMKYDRVRVYSVDKNSWELKGIAFAGKHNKLNKDSFKKRNLIIPSDPSTLRSHLTNLEKTGLLKIGSNEEAVDMHKYWSMGLLNEQLQTLDPDGILELDDVPYLLVVPIFTKKDFWVIFVDMKYNKREANADDLQALSTFARICSATLDMVTKFELRFRLNSVETTAMGLEHVFFRRNRPEQIKMHINKRINNIVNLAVQYLKTSSLENTNRCLAEVLPLVFHQLDDTQRRLLNKGEVKAAADRLSDMLRRMRSLSLKDNVLCNLARIRIDTAESIGFWANMISSSPDDTMWNLVSELIKFVSLLENVTRRSDEIRILADAFTEISKTGIPLGSSSLYDIELPARLAVESLQRLALEKKVSIIRKFVQEELCVKIKAEEVFLALQTLIKNAIIAASQDKQPKVEVSINCDADKNYAKISITNNGKIYNLKEDIKTYNRTLRVEEDEMGAGLGLIFAQRWICSGTNKGKIRHENQKGETTFYVEFPLYSQTQDNFSISRSIEDDMK